MKLNFPTFYQIDYPQKNKKYYNYNNQKEIKDILTKSSNGYCMYCGNSIIINGKNIGQLEHSIEKKQNEVEIKYLKHCKYNMSIACSVCNTSFKKSSIKSIDINENHFCKEKCDEECKEYLINKEEYISKNAIILMPKGIKINSELGIEYDLLNLRFDPSEDKGYSEEELNFIQNHINRFMLNSEEYMPIDIFKICIHIIKYNDIPEKGNYSNVIADIFIDYLKDIQEINLNYIKKLCELILIYNLL